MNQNTKNNQRLDELFDLTEETRKAYANDETTLTPVALFVNAFRKLYEELTYRPTDRYAGALRFLKELNARIGELEADEDAPGVWRLWENALRAVDAYDRRERAKTTPPKLTIDELLEQGVGKRQIALIYGFIDENGEPDTSKVDAREPWRPHTNEDETHTEHTTDDDAATNEAVKKEPTPNAPQSITTPQEANFTEIDAEIAAGVPIRQIAANHGLEVAAIKERAGIGRRGRPRKEPDDVND